MKTFDAMPFREWMEKLYKRLSGVLRLKSLEIIEDGALKNGRLVGSDFSVFVLAGGADQSIEVVIEDKQKEVSWNLSKTAQLEGVLQWMVDNRAESKSPEDLLDWTFGYLESGLRGHPEFSLLYK